MLFEHRFLTEISQPLRFIDYNNAKCVNVRTLHQRLAWLTRERCFLAVESGTWRHAVNG